MSFSLQLDTRLHKLGGFKMAHATGIAVSAAAVVLSAVGLLVGKGANEVVDPNDPPERILSLVSLTYAEGDFTQEFFASTEGMQASWKASIHQGDRIVCAPGSGVGGYASRKTTMAIDVWTGNASCEARLVDGETYTGEGSWEYESADETTVTITGKVNFIYQRE